MVTAACYIEWKGLVAGNGYIVKDFINAGGYYLVVLRNPWKQIGDANYKGSSHGDWVGRFSKEDNATWTPELKAQAFYDEL